MRSKSVYAALFALIACNGLLAQEFQGFAFEKLLPLQQGARQGSIISHTMEYDADGNTGTYYLLRSFCPKKKITEHFDLTGLSEWKAASERAWNGWVLWQHVEKPQIKIGFKLFEQSNALYTHRKDWPSATAKALSGNPNYKAAFWPEKMPENTADAPALVASITPVAQSAPLMERMGFVVFEDSILVMIVQGPKEEMEAAVSAEELAGLLSNVSLFFLSVN